MPNTMRRNLLIIAAILGTMLAVKALDTALAPNHAFPGRTAAFPWTEMMFTAVAALLGVALGSRSPVVTIWPAGAARALLPALGLGAALGVVLAIVDAWLRIGDINVGLPLAPLFYLWGAISQETITHFAPVAIIVGLMSNATDSHRAHAATFWAAAILMSVVAALGMVLAFQNPAIPLSQNSTAAPMVIGAAVFLIELALFAMFRAKGYVAALVMRLGFYAIWHIAWPALAY